MTEYKRQPTDDEIVKIEDDIDIEATRRNITRAIQLANMFGYKVSLQAHSYIGIP
jgi:organic radical activating enzyme